jgi:hypothetical protein
VLSVAVLALLTGACGAPLAVTGASYAADGTSLLTTDKTLADHFTSMVSKKDCALWRVFRGRAVCRAREDGKDPYDVDYSQPQHMVAEDGVQYAPPLRAAPDAPAVSWDADAYQPAPSTAPPAPAAPVTAVAESGQPTAAPATVVPKPKKSKVHSARKASRGRAAPGS